MTSQSLLYGRTVSGHVLVVVDLLFIFALVCLCFCLVHVFYVVNCILSSFAITRAGCLFMSTDCYCCVSLPHGAMNLSAAYVCGISWPCCFCYFPPLINELTNNKKVVLSCTEYRIKKNNSECL